MKKHYKVILTTKTNKTFIHNWFGKEKDMVDKFIRMTEFYEFKQMQIYRNNEKTPFLIYN